jgi:hypothetical protein
MEVRRRSRPCLCGAWLNLPPEPVGAGPIAVKNLSVPLAHAQGDGHRRDDGAWLPGGVNYTLGDSR